MEDITDADYAHKKNCKNVVIKKKTGRISWFVCSKGYIILEDIFENLRNTCFEIYELHPAKFISDPGFAWQVALKKTKVNLVLLTDIDVLLMVEKILEEEHVTSFVDIQKLITNTWKIMIKINSHHIFNIGMKIVNMDGKCHKRFQ